MSTGGPPYSRDRPESSGEPVAAGEGRGRRSRRPWVLLLILALLLAALVIGALILWRSLGDELSGTASASDSIDSGPTPKVTLNNTAGQVSVEGVDDLRAVEYEVTKHAIGGDPAVAKQNASDVAIDISREGGEISLQTNGGRDTGADYALRVPTGAAVEVESEAGSVEVRNLNGGVRVSAGAGDVSVTQVKGPVSIEVPQGDVDVSEISTDTGQTEIEVGTGDVSLENLVVGTLEASVEAGDVLLSGRFSGNGRVSVGTGDITVQLPPEDTRELTLEARVGEIERENAEDKPSGQSKDGS